MIRRRHPAEDRLTGLELVILLAVFISVTAVMLVYLGGWDIPDWVRTFPGVSLQRACMYPAINTRLSGTCSGFPRQAEPPVIFPL